MRNQVPVWYHLKHPKGTIPLVGRIRNGPVGRISDKEGSTARRGSHIFDSEGEKHTVWIIIGKCDRNSVFRAIPNTLWPPCHDNQGTFLAQDTDTILNHDKFLDATSRFEEDVLNFVPVPWNCIN